MNHTYLSVGELAKQMGVSVRTLQYYDKKGLLQPSAMSEGGRRLYTKKDMVKLHQILSLKYLGFSLEEIKDHLLPLDTSPQVREVLKKQRELVQGQIDNLKNALFAIDALYEEVCKMDTVDFEKYADIITLLRQNNENYWVIKLFDHKLIDHIKDRFGAHPERGMQVFQTYQNILDEALVLIRSGQSPQSEAAIDLAGRWWNMINDFTGGDMSLLPLLIQFNENKSGWDEEMKHKQTMADDYIEQALECYFNKGCISIPISEE